MFTDVNVGSGPPVLKENVLARVPGGEYTSITSVMPWPSGAMGAAPTPEQLVVQARNVNVPALPEPTLWSENSHAYPIAPSWKHTGAAKVRVKFQQPVLFAA